MKEKMRFALSASIWALILLAASAVAVQAQSGPTNYQPAAKKGVTLQASGPSLPVQGSGAVGRLPKWTGLTSSNSFIGDSTIFEDKYGMVGIGTDSPTSKLTVAGMIQITLGGLKFPDGTVQTTARLGSISHDATLKGDGSSASPLGIALPLSLVGESQNPVVFVINREKHIGAAGLTAGGGDTDINGGFGGTGLTGIGGYGLTGSGGAGVHGVGGIGPYGGEGVSAFGGGPLSGLSGQGGVGLRALGGIGQGAGYIGGTGLLVFAGPGFDGAIDGHAADFIGVVDVFGNFNVAGGGTKNFKIDHPLDPENKYLYHAAIESSEVLNIYSGNVTSDENGNAVVTLPEWFEAVNRDFRYQLTVVGAFAQAIIGNKINDNRFTIKTNAPSVEVSWLVMGLRSDAAIRKHPFRVEEDKPESERGSYLAPDAYNQPEERGIQWARNPQMMQQRKESKPMSGQTRPRPGSDN